MRELSIDIETYSSVDIKKSGLYKYVQSPDFEILLFAYAFDDEPVQIVDLAQGERIPADVMQALWTPEIIKTAYNASFEWYCLSKHFGYTASYLLWLPQWHCSMVHGMYCGFPSGLAAIGKALGMPEEKRKLSTGRALIKRFCTPCEPTDKNGHRTRTLPRHEPEKWQLFKEYCVRDVVTEREVKRRLAHYPMPEAEWELWRIDQGINARGVALDRDLIDGALTIHAEVCEQLTDEAAKLTGLDNPNSIGQLKSWLYEQTGREIESLNKADLPALIESIDNDTVRRVLAIRQELGKTSVKKYDTMQNTVCADGRARGMLQFYGANRTGRWAGRFVQVQNLPRNYIESLDLARELVKDKKAEHLKMLYGNVPDTLSQLIRTAFIPKDGHYFAVADFSAIEARVIAWLAHEDWVLDVFRTHGKIYEATAASMFGVPIEKIKKGNPEYALRQKGKVATLALGYQGGVGALIQMRALEMGIPEADLPDIVARWRSANPRIVAFWYTVEEYARRAVELGETNSLPCGVTFGRDQNFMFITLPSGRRLFYPHPMLANSDKGRKQLVYHGVAQGSKQWQQIPTYGGKLTENIVQAVARDCLANSMVNLTNAGYPIVMHIHDECVLELPKDGERTLDKAIKIMCQNPPWAAGLPLSADGFTAEYYKKD